MSEHVFDKVNDFNSARIGLASPSDIRSWSFGEVKKPETINYRTYRPEKDGLFCERIFGPERDYECGCGKYKGTKFKGIICDRCGVKVTHSRVRRKRMGHINLAASTVHIWFFKALPSRLGTLLAMKTSDLEKIIYFQDYVILVPGDADIEGAPVEYKQVITEDQYREIRSRGGYGDFRAEMGAGAVRELIEALDLHEEVLEIREGLANTRSKQKTADLAKRLKLIEHLRTSHNEPEWMILDVVPVIPPELRPLVMLESGNFATSDLNDLYRRIINRNNRLKKLMDLNAPEVIIRNEKRMLQQAVDALFDNGRCRRPVLGSSNRPLKSITDMIKGKQGRFRENLLGKRVDYSARSVIVVGPNLKLNQCGLPKKIALELFQPFIIRRLKDQGLADTIKSAKRMLERRDEEVWDILEQVIHQHPVLLNRAPTLHRMGIQAFEPVLVEGKAITLHPLVCTGFNADFDGDQMAVHLPLSVEAQTEAQVLMLSTHNIFSPAHGNPLVSPSQDIVMGVYFLTHMDLNDTREEKELRKFRNAHEAILAYDYKQISLQEKIQIRLPRYPKVVNDEKGPVEEMPSNGRIITTVGRILFCEILAQDMPFYNCTLTKKGCSRVIDDTYEIKGRPATLTLLDDMKEVGFKASTWSGISIAITDMRIPSNKEELLEGTQSKVDRVEIATAAGAITNQERHNQLLDLWSHCREELTVSLIKTLEVDRRNPEDNSYIDVDSNDGIRYLNPVYLMSTSGARGNVSQMQQLAGMRGLMTKPSGEIIETPIKANFRQGLNVLEYFSSTHGARKGLADTALKTADSGYLTRKLYDVAQPVVINDYDCATKRGITKRAVYKNDEIHVQLRELIIGRTSMQTVINPVTDQVIVSNKQVINEKIAINLEQLNIDAVQVRSPLTCESESGCCALCYGHDLSTSQLVEEGMAVGTIAAQSIGEPGTQLTMRTFHTGGVASREFVETNYKAPHSGTMMLRDCNEVPLPENNAGHLITLKQTGELFIVDDKGREIDKAFRVPYGAILRMASGTKVKKGNILVEWDPHVMPILAEKTGTVVFKDIEIGTTLREEENKGVSERIITEHTGELHPQVLIQENEQTLDFHHLPAKARLEVKTGDTVVTGQMLARRPREVKGTADIVGGLPRVTEIFEARVPKEPSILAQVTGRVDLQSDRKRGKMVIHIVPENSDPVEHLVPQGKHLLVHTGDKVIAGSQLTEGPRDPNNILDINGEEALYNYMISEVQNVYRAQGVPVSDKHIEVILSRMLSKIQVQKAGDTEMLPLEFVERYKFRVANKLLDSLLIVKDAGDTGFAVGDLIDKDEIKEANAIADAEGKAPAKTTRPKKATGKPLLLGITKAALQSESFLSGASFQETTKVLTEAALRGAEDHLKGLKENVLLGHLVPAGTGFEPYKNMKVKLLVDPPAIDEHEEESMIAAATARAEALGARSSSPAVQIPASSSAEVSEIL
ncbi:MAG: DNA-directed RNA polymerase subunit beta' [Phycisphaerae bacterium]|nr:DNA-directed RNA polymerase subunit beta' [Phycisphaerae bacterium]